MTDQALTPYRAGRPDPEAAALRRRRAVQRWRDRSRTIHFFRRALPATIIAVVVLLAVWVSAKGLLIGLIDARDSAASIHMTNARFFGRDGDGRAYILGAAEAAREEADLHHIRLRGAIIALNAGSPNEIRISSDRGLYLESNRLLHLNGRVVVKDGNGDTFVTDEAIIDTINATVMGSARIRGTGPTGAIAANAFQIFDQGRRVVFSGDVHSRIKQD